MKYYIGEDKQELSLKKYLSFGEEGNVYIEGNEAVKIYYDNWESSKHSYLTEEEARKMTKIKTNQILLPRRLVYDEKGNFCGYSTKLIRTFYPKCEGRKNAQKERFLIDNMFLCYLKNKIKRIYAEMRFLSHKGIILEDFFYPSTNYIFNGEFYLIDPGCYAFSTESVEKTVERNTKTLNSFFASNCLLLGEDFLERTNAPANPSYSMYDFIEENERPLEKTYEFRNRIKK